MLFSDASSCSSGHFLQDDNSINSHVIFEINILDSKYYVLRNIKSVLSNMYLRELTAFAMFEFSFRMSEVAERLQNINELFVLLSLLLLLYDAALFLEGPTVE